MDSNQTKPSITAQEDDSLDKAADGSDSDATAKDSTEIVSADSATPAAAPPPPAKLWRRLIGRLNIYLLLFLLVLAIAIAIIVVSYLNNKHSTTPSTISSQTLSESALQQLANTDANVGNTGQILNVKSSAVFAGNVLVRQDLQIAGNLQVGGTLALNNISVSGTAQFSQVQINSNLSVAGTTALQGALTIAKTLQVGGGASFSGPLSAPQLTVTSLQLNGDLVLTHHITAGGPAPSLSKGSALGGGGTASISGSDTSGSIDINTGSSPAAGCFAIINFNSKYNATPHVLITPVGAGAGGLSYYVDRSTSSFSICDATPPPSGDSFGFDYFIVD